MTSRTMQISFLPQDIGLIRNFLHGRNYSKIISDDKTLGLIYVDMSKIESYDSLCSGIADLIMSLIKERNLKDYIWKTYTNINEEDKKSVYIEAINLFDKKEDFIKETIYSKVNEFVVENNDLNLDGFLKFRMKDFTSYISILSDIALEEHLIKRDKKEFLDSLKYFIDIQEEKMGLLRITIMKDGHFVLSDENGNEIENLNNEEIRTLAMEENLNNEDRAQLKNLFQKDLNNDEKIWIQTKFEETKALNKAILEAKEYAHQAALAIKDFSNEKLQDIIQAMIDRDF